MARTFNQMVGEAMGAVPVISAAEAQRRADRARPIITACQIGPLGALAAKLLHDMGFTNVSIMDGGTQAWKDAGFPTV